MCGDLGTGGLLDEVGRGQALTSGCPSSFTVGCLCRGGQARSWPAITESGGPVLGLWHRSVP